MALDFYLAPEDVRAYQADAWAAPHLKVLADDWEQQALAKLNAPVPDPDLAAHLGGATPQETPQTEPTDAMAAPVAPEVPIAPEPTPAAPQAAPTLPAPDAPLPTDYGPVPRSPQRQPIPTAPVAPTPSPSPVGNLVNYARQAAQKVGIDPDLFTRQINQESNFNPAARSPAGAQGIAQIVPRWHPGVDVTDPYASLDYAANLMSSLIKQHGGDVRTALVAYNGGQGAVDALNAGTPYAESREYVNRIMSGGAPAVSTQDPAKVAAIQSGDWKSVAEGQLGKPYIWGSAGGRTDLSQDPAGFDCSGFVSWVYNKGLGLNLPAFTGSIQQATQAISQDQARPGDIVMYNMHQGDPHLQHVGIYLGNGMMIDSTGGGVREEPVWSNPEFRRDPRVADGKSVDLVGTAIDTAIARPSTTEETARGDQVKQALSPRPDETISNPFGEAFRQVGNVAGQVGDALGGIGRAKDRAIYGPSGRPLTQEEVNANWQRGSEALGGAQVTVPANPLDVLGGSGLGVPTGGEQMTAERDRWIAENNPLRDVPVVGGATTMAGQAIADPTNLMLAGPGIGKAVAREAGPALEAAGPAIGRFAASEEGGLRIPSSAPAPPPSGPPTQGSTAYRTLLNMYGDVKTSPINAIPGQLEEARRAVVRRWTDRGIDLAEFQKDAQRAAGRSLTADEMAYEMRRLNPSGAASMRVQNELKPAIQSVGQDVGPLKVYLTAKDNLDVAAAMGQKVQGAAVDAIPEANAAVRNAEAVLRGRQQYLDRLTADVNAPPERIRAAQNSVNSAQRSVDTARTNYDAVRTAKLGEAARTGAEASANRQFSGGLSAADSQAALDHMAQELGPDRMAKVEQAGQQIVDYGRSLLQRKVDAGLISQDLYDELTTRYPNYSPTRIVDYLKDPAGIPNGRKISVQSAGLKSNTIEGTVRQREDPLASFVRLGYETEALATRNEVGQAFLKLRDLNPDTALMIRKVSDDTPNPRGFEKMKVFENGVPQTYQMPDYIAKAIKEEPVAPVPFLTPLMNIFRALATQRNPLFLASNALNDAVSYTIRSSSRLGGPQNAPKIATELVKAYGDAFQGILKAEYRGNTARYMEGGGAMSGFFSHSPQEAQKLANELQLPHVFAVRSDHMLEDVKRLVGQALLLKPVEAIGERIELAPRVAAMRLAEKAGATQQQAVLAGRTVTLDFSQGGTWAKTLNQYIPFFNTAMQAAATPVRAFSENPRGFIATAISLLAAPTVGFEAWNRSDPQRAKDYEDVPQYVKDQGLVFMLPAKPQVDAKGNRKPQYLFFPTREYSPFVTLTREAAGRAMGQDPRDWGNLLLGTGKSVSPISGNSGADVLSSFVPLGVSTSMQLANDQDWYRGGHIMSQTADEQAAAFSKAAAAALQKMGMQARPSGVEFAVRDLAAGVGSTGLAASDIVAGQPRRDTRVQSTPGVGGLIGRFVQDRTGQQLTNAIDQPVAQNVETALHDAGIPTPTIPYTISVRSQMTGNQSPPIELRQQERAEYQRLMSERLNERLAPILTDPSWAQRPIASRNKVLDTQVKAAREYAEAKVYSAMAPEDRQARMQAGRLAQQPKARP